MPTRWREAPVTGLRDLQAAVRTAVLDDEERALRHAIRGDGIAPAARLAIYRHHVLHTLTDVLASTFPVVCRLVDARFFVYAADRYIRAKPPASPCLFEYGETFAEFLATFSPCRHLAYLPDVARLEWALNVAHHAEDASPLDPVVLASVPETAAARLRLYFHPAVTYLRTAWPADRIWEAHREGADPDQQRVAPEDVRLEVRRTATDEVIFRRLPPPDFAFRRTLAAGRPLGEAAYRAAAADATFDLPAALAALLADTIVVGFGIQETEDDEHDERQRTR